MSPRAIFNIVGFQAVWFACAYGAARGLSWPGIVAAILFIAIHLAAARDSRRALAIILASGLMGCAVESALVASGVLRYVAPWPSPAVAPAWIVALWLAFGATLGPLRALIGANVMLHALAGAIFGPIAYFAGGQAGAIILQSPAWKIALVLALIWAAALPALFKILVTFVCQTGSPTRD